MTEPKLEITTGGRTIVTPLRPGLTRIGPLGGRGVHVEIDGATGELHIWDEPPKVVRVQGDDALVADGNMVEEALLEDGTVFAWSGAKFRYLAPAPAPAVAPVLPEPVLMEPVLMEIVEEAPPLFGGPGGNTPGAGTVLGENELRAWRRVSAGLLVEVGLADKKATKRWQAAVVRQEWDADAAARDILAASAAGTSDPKFVERAGRLERDLLMSSFQSGVKGASRRARGAARSTTAFLLANVIAIVCYSAIILALAILARIKYEWTLDGIIDRMVEAVTPALMDAPIRVLPDLFSPEYFPEPSSGSAAPR